MMIHTYTHTHKLWKSQHYEEGNMCSCLNMKEAMPIAGPQESRAATSFFNSLYTPLLQAKMTYPPKLVYSNNNIYHTITQHTLLTRHTATTEHSTTI